jgi:cation transport regulator ChaC
LIHTESTQIPTEIVSSPRIKYCVAAIGNQQGIASTLAMLAQILAVHQQDFGTAIDYLQQLEAILRRIGSPVADQVAETLQQVRGLMN